MSNAVRKRQRNMTLECCRMVAAMFIVFLHVPFPGEFGSLVACLSRFGVPMFFAISGWYSYRTQPKKLLKRAVRLWLLELTGIVLQLTWSCVQGHFEGIPIWDSLLWRMPDANALIKWLVFQVDPFSGPLWYLSAAAVCCLLLAVFVRIFGGRSYRHMYVLSGLLLICCFAVSEFSRFTQIRVDYTVYRSAWFTGIPMFVTGLGLRQIREGLSEKEKQAAAVPAALLILGLLLSIAEWRRFGGYDLYVGTVIAVVGLMLLTAARPDVPRWLEKMADSFGFLSTGVYMIHMIVYEAYGYFFSWKLEARLGEITAWVVPLLVAAVSVLAALACYGVRLVWRKHMKSK